MNAHQFFESLCVDPMTVETLKKSPEIPMEKTLLPRAEHLEFLGKIPETSHLRDHWNYFNQEQMDITIQALSTENPQALESRRVEYNGIVIDQYKFRLEHPVWSRRVWLPVEMADRAILHRRHSKTPGVDFIVPLSDEIKALMSRTDTQILTIRRGGDIPIPGTGYAGTHFPGSSDPDDFTGILYKWYKSDEERSKDITKFGEGIKTRIPALVDPVDYQELVLKD